MKKRKIYSGILKGKLFLIVLLFVGAFGFISSANILNNGGFEYGLQCYENWVLDNGEDISGFPSTYNFYMSDDRIEGSYSVEVRCLSPTVCAGSRSKGYFFPKNIINIPGQSYIVSFYAKCINGGTASLYSNSVSTGEQEWFFPTCDSIWRPFSMTFTTDSDPYIYVNFRNNDLGSTFYDNITITYSNGTAPNPTPVQYPGDRNVVWDNNKLIVDGKPFFALGFFGVDYNDLSVAAATGANIVTGFGAVAEDCFNTGGQNYFDRAYSLGLNVAPDYTFSARTTNTTIFENIMNRFGHHQSFVALFLADEPNHASVTRFRIPSATLAAQYNEISSRTNVPVYADLHSNPPTNAVSYNNTMDFWMAEPYDNAPFPNSLITVSNLKGINNRPIWLAQSMSSSYLTNPTYQIPKTYWQIINNVTGIIIFDYSGAKSSGHLPIITQMFSEINNLSSVIFSPSVTSQFASSSSLNDGYLNFTARQNGSDYYILSVYRSTSTITGTFSSSLLTLGQNVEVLFENRNITAQNGYFTDSFAGVSRHVYKISTASTPSTGECQLLSSSWSTTNVNELQQVTLNVYGDSNCTNGESVNFVAWESDALGGDDSVSINPASAVFNNGVATSTWTAEWQEDCGGLCNPPEYYFVSSLAANPLEFVASNNQLTVNKVVTQNELFVAVPETANLGESFLAEVRARVGPGDNLYSLQYDIDYNPSLLSVNSVREGTMLNQSGSVLTFFGYNLSSGHISNLYIVRNTTTGITTSEGVTAIINFTAIGGGSTNIGLKNAIWLNSTFTNISGTQLPVSLDNGTISVSAPAVCGDSIIGNGEYCDDSNAVAGDGCSATCQIETGWTCPGTPSVCAPICGDGLILGTEQCDGSNLNSQTCLTQGFPGGTLSCSSCLFNTASCLGYGTLQATQIIPNVNGNVTQNALFTYTTRVTCVGGICGNVNATLDPIFGNTNYSIINTPYTSITNNTKVGSRFQMGSQPGKLQYVRAYFYGYLNNTIYAAVYDDNAGVPGNRIAVASWGPPSSASVYNVTFNFSNESLNADAYYWLVLGSYSNGSASSARFYHNGIVGYTNQHAVANLAPPFSTTFGTPSYGTRVHIIYAYYTIDSSVKGIVPMNSGTPFYTIDQNPTSGTYASCLQNMQPGTSCDVTWRVNATGNVNSNYTFFTILESTSYPSNVAPINSPNIVLTISNISAPLPCTDVDGDGYNLTSGGVCGAQADCDDNNASINPGAAEVCSNIVDDNCNGQSDYDMQDGLHGDAACPVVFSNPQSIGSVFAIESGPYYENSYVTLGCYYNSTLSVNSINGFIYQGASKIYCNYINSVLVVSDWVARFNCSTGAAGTKMIGCEVNSSRSYSTNSPQNTSLDIVINCVDSDNDGYSPVGGSCGVVDCDDSNSNKNPGETEACDGFDNDCDASIDEGGDTLCDDSLYCNGAEICGGNIGCQFGTEPETNDGISCTVDSCDEANNVIVHTNNDAACTSPEVCNPIYFPTSSGCGVITTCTGQPDGTACDDGLFCNGADSCVSQSCSPGIGLNVDDGVACTMDSCNETNNVVLHGLNNSICDNGLYCDGAEICSDSGCQSGTSIDCSNTDPYSCTVDSCDEGSDACIISVPNNALCGSGETCDPNQFGAPTGCGIVQTCNDIDNDGYGNPASFLCLNPEFDCNDNDPNTYYGASEICGDTIDQNCDGSDLICPSSNCTIDSMSWGVTNTDEGATVTMTLTGTNCEGVPANLYVKEYDGLASEVGGDDSVNIGPSLNPVVFSSGAATSTWTAEWQDDGFLNLAGDPEYYFIASVDSGNFESGKSSSELLSVNLVERKYEVINIPLQAGKNSFSLPLIPADGNYNIASIFSSIYSQADRIYTYDGGFEIYNFDSSVPSNLADLEIGKGYVLFMKQAAVLTINGSTRDADFSRPTIQLNPGWNMIGTFSNSYEANKILGNVDYSMIYSYNPLTQQFVPISDTSLLNNTASYWIYVNQPSTFIPLTGLVSNEE